MSDSYRIRLWMGRNPDGDDYQGEPDATIRVEGQTPYLWQDDPHFHSPPMGMDIHPEDCPATLEVFTSDSVHPADPRYKDSGYVDESYWNGPMERGLYYPADHDYSPFGCEIWGRVLFYVKPDE